MNQKDGQTEWLSIIGKSLAHLCINTVMPDTATLGDKAHFLERLGLERKDVAEILNTTPASVTELLRLKRNKGSAKNVKKKSKK